MSELSYEELKAKLAELQQAGPAAHDGGPLYFKVAAKGGVSAYGLGRLRSTGHGLNTSRSETRSC